MPLLIFAFNRLVYRASEFIRHWYIGSFYRLAHFLISGLENLDQFFAVKASLRRLNQPIFYDNILGYFFGFTLGALRIIVGVVLYSAITAVILAGFLIWAAVPPFLIFKAAGFNF